MKKKFFVFTMPLIPINNELYLLLFSSMIHNSIENLKEEKKQISL